MNNLRHLTKQHIKTMLLLNEAEHWLIASYNPDQEARLYTLIQELTDTAETLTGHIHDLKHNREGARA